MVSHIWADSVQLWNGSWEMDPEHSEHLYSPIELTWVLKLTLCEKEDYLQALRDFPNFSLWVLC